MKHANNKHKFTTDGRKVLVIGKLNNHESIVQEVFVTDDGAEVPSGENFTVKSLHDAPVKSWAEKRCEEIKSRLAGLESELDKEYRRTNIAKRKAGQVANALDRFASTAANEQLATLAAFVSGEITHLVRGGHIPKIQDFDASLSANSEFDRDNIKLLSLFGRTDGNMEWRLHHYSDHSGGSSIVIPARGYHDAVSIAQRMYDDLAGAWRAGDTKHPPTTEWVKNIPDIKEHDDVLQHRAAEREKSRVKRIAKLEEEIAELRGCAI